MCRWMGWYLHVWVDYSGAAFSLELLEWGRKFQDLGDQNIHVGRDL